MPTPALVILLVSSGIGDTGVGVFAIICWSLFFGLEIKEGKSSHYGLNMLGYTRVTGVKTMSKT